MIQMKLETQADTYLRSSETLYQVRAYFTSNTYYDWVLDRVFVYVPAQNYVAKFLGTFKEFPPRQKPASFTIDQVIEKLQTPVGSH